MRSRSKADDGSEKYRLRRQHWRPGPSAYPRQMAVPLPEKFHRPSDPIRAEHWKILTAGGMSGMIHSWLSSGCHLVVDGKHPLVPVEDQFQPLDECQSHMQADLRDLLFHAKWSTLHVTKSVARSFWTRPASLVDCVPSAVLSVVEKAIWLFFLGVVVWASATGGLARHDSFIISLNSDGWIPLRRPSCELQCWKSTQARSKCGEEGGLGASIGPVLACGRSASIRLNHWHGSAQSALRSGRWEDRTLYTTQPVVPLAGTECFSSLAPLLRTPSNERRYERLPPDLDIRLCSKPLPRRKYLVLLDSVPRS